MSSAPPQQSEGLFPPGVPIPTAGASILLEMEDAKKKQDLPKLKEALLKARSLPNVNLAWLDNALTEIENLSKVQQTQGGTSVVDIAKQCKEQGNQALKEGNAVGAAPAAAATEAASSAAASQKQKLKHFKQAGEHYTNGIAVLSQFLGSVEKKETEAKKQGKDPATLHSPEQAKQIGEAKVVLSQLYSNRAQVLLNIREFVGCVDDCKRCLTLDPKNSKAYYRGARASLLNGLYQQAVDFCQSGLEALGEDVSSPFAADLTKLQETAHGKLEHQKNLKEKLNVSHSELLEQQQNVQRLFQQVQQLEAQIQAKKTKQKAQGFTKAYCEQLGEAVPKYVGCGKAFVLREHNGLVQDMTEQMEKVAEELPKMEKAYEEVKTRFEKANAEFEEIVKCMQRRGGGGS